MKFVSIKRDILKQISAKLVASVLFLLMTTSIANAMADNVHIYEISEGSDSVEVRTFSTDPVDILKDAGYDPNDYEILSEAMRGNQLIGLRIGKKFPVVVYDGGEKRICETASKTIGQLFLQQGIILSAFDIVSPSVTDLVNEETEIHITRVNDATITEERMIPLEVEKHYNDQLSYGSTRILKAGSTGVITSVYNVTYHSGVETARTLISEEVTEEGTPQVIEIGTAGAVVAEDGEIYPYKQIVNVLATAYSTEGWKNKHTYTQTVARVGTVAVDPSVIPLGSKLYITSADGKEWIYGLAVAEDTGSLIQGNRIDLFFDTQEECVDFGVSDALVYVLK